MGAQQQLFVAQVHAWPCLLQAFHRLAAPCCPCSVVLVGDPQQLPATILSELAKQVI